MFGSMIATLLYFIVTSPYAVYMLIAVGETHRSNSVESDNPVPKYVNPNVIKDFQYDRLSEAEKSGWKYAGRTQSIDPEAGRIIHFYERKR